MLMADKHLMNHTLVEAESVSLIRDFADMLYLQVEVEKVETATSSVSYPELLSRVVTEFGPISREELLIRCMYEMPFRT